MIAFGALTAIHVLLSNRRDESEAQQYLHDAPVPTSSPPPQSTLVAPPPTSPPPVPKTKKPLTPLTTKPCRPPGELEAAEAKYNTILQEIKNPATDPSRIPTLQADLKRSSRLLRMLKKLNVIPPPPPSYSHYPTPTEIPRDPTDPRFTISFTLDEVEAAKDFFNEWGFLVYRDILSPSECDATVSEIWDYLEEAHHPNLSRLDPTTHSQLSARYGLPDDQAIFTPQFVKNRQNLNLHRALNSVTPLFDESLPSPTPASEVSPNSLTLSHDRFCVYPPSKCDPTSSTTNPPVHLDICPWSYYPDAAHAKRDEETDPDRLTYHGDTRIRELVDWRAEINCVRGEVGDHHQGLISLLDNLEEDGGTVVVPKFHKSFKSWQKALGTWEENRVGQRRRGCSFNFHNPSDPIHKLARRVTLRKGSLLVWDQRTVHGAVPNRSESFRIAQFVRGFRRGEMTAARAKYRAQALATEFRRGGVQSLDPISRHVFGLDWLEYDRSLQSEQENTQPQTMKTLVNKHWNI